MRKKSLWERLRGAPDPPEERPSHARRLSELEARLDDIESQVEKIGAAVRTWAGRLAKRAAADAVKAIEGQPSADLQSEGNVAPNGPNLQQLSKEQVRAAFARGQIRKLGS